MWDFIFFQYTSCAQNYKILCVVKYGGWPNNGPKIVSNIILVLALTQPHKQSVRANSCWALNWTLSI